MNEERRGLVPRMQLVVRHAPLPQDMSVELRCGNRLLDRGAVWSVADEDPAPVTVRGRTVRAQGPERIAGEWWRERAPTRDYYRVEDTDGRRFWLYRDNFDDPRETRWFLHGLFG